MTIICLVLFMNNIIFSLMALFILFVLAVLNGNMGLLVTKTFKSFWLLVVLLVIMQALFFSGSSPDIFIGSLGLKSQGLYYGINLSLILVVIGFSAYFMFDTTEIKDLAYAFERKGIDKRISYVLIATFQVIPQMSQESKQIAIAQQSRGLSMDGNIFQRARSFLPVINTLVLGSIVSAEERTLTLESKGFSMPTKKTSLFQLEDTSLDKYIRFALITIFIGGILWRMISWLGLI